MKLGFPGRVVMLAVLAVCVGCGTVRKITKTTCHDTKPYMAAKSVPPLQIPPGLDATDTTSAMKIPRLNEPELPQRKGKDPCLDEPPAFTTPKTQIPQA
jgi:uncharacterized lipoprotein